MLWLVAMVTALAPMQEENVRFLNLALHQGQVGKKLAVNMVSYLESTAEMKYWDLQRPNTYSLQIRILRAKTFGLSPSSSLWMLKL